MGHLIDISYDPDEHHPARKFDLHLPATSSSAIPLVCFVHGGAWRSEDKADHAKLAQRIAIRNNIAIAVPNYRLSPKQPSDGPALPHPSHAEDVLAFLSFILTWRAPGSSGQDKDARPAYFDSAKIVLIGHSCSAHMLASIFLDSSSITPSLTPSPEILSAVQAIVVSEGIYDIDALLDSFPSYKGYFVAAAFGDGPSYQSVSVTKYPLRAPHIRWLVLHSKGDTLIDQQQSDLMLSHLSGLYAASPSDMVLTNFSELTEEHDELLAGDTYLNILSNYLSASTK